MNISSRVSVVIPTLNRHQVLIKCLKRILEQKEQLREIIVVDQTEHCPKFAQKFFSRHPEIKYFYLAKKNLPVARNFGWRRAQGNIILFLDDDSLISPEFFRAHLTNYKNQKVGAVTGREILENKPEFYTHGKAQEITEAGEIKPNTTSIDKSEVDSCWGANMSFRKKVLEKVGGFDENYSGNAMREESDISMRLRLAGYKIVFEPKAQIVHLAVKSGGCRTGRKLDWYFHFFHNEMYFFLKFFPRKYLINFYLRKLRPILVCMFLRGRGMPSALILPFRAFKEAKKILKKEKGNLAPIKIGIDAREAFIKQKAGKGEYVYQLTKTISQIDHKNLYFIYTRHFPQEKFPPNFKIRLIKGPKLFWFFRAILDLKAEGVDIFFSPTSFIIPALVPKKCIPVVHDLAVFKKNFQPLLKAKILETLLLGRIMKKNKILITISESTKKDLMDHYFFLNKEKIEIVYPAYDHIFKKATDSEIERILSRYQIKRPYVLALGTIEPRKNFKNLILAFSRLSKEIFDTHTLVIIGKKGWYAEEIISLVKNLNLETKIKFLGYAEKKDLVALYSGAKIFAFPSLWEGFGMPILEALACEIPVLTSKTSSMPEAAGKAGIYTNPLDLNDIKEKLEEILSNDSLRKDLIANSESQIQKFSWDNSAKKLIRIFEKFVKLK